MIVLFNLHMYMYIYLSEHIYCEGIHVSAILCEWYSSMTSPSYIYVPIPIKLLQSSLNSKSKVFHEVQICFFFVRSFLAWLKGPENRHQSKPGDS